jgi:hypothetical protein
MFFPSNHEEAIGTLSIHQDHMSSSWLAVYPVPNQSAREAWYCRQMCWLHHVTSSPSIVDQKSDSKLFGAIPILVNVTQQNLVQYQPVPQAGSIASHNGVLFHGQYHPISRIGFLWKWENGYSPFSDTAKYHVSYISYIHHTLKIVSFCVDRCPLYPSKAQTVSSHSAVSSHIGLSGRWVEKVRRRNSGWYLGWRIPGSWISWHLAI